MSVKGRPSMQLEDSDGAHDRKGRRENERITDCKEEMQGQQ